MVAQTPEESQKVVDTYFEYLAAIHAGDAGAVERMLDLFSEDASWEYLGPDPLVGEFRGRLALEVLFRNLTRGPELEIAFERKAPSGARVSPVEVIRRYQRGRRVVVHWSQEVRTGKEEGIVLDGSTTFDLREGRIVRARGIAMPRRVPEALPAGLSMEELTVEDVGRLALAAWAVV